MDYGKHQNNPAFTESVRVFKMLKLDIIRKEKREEFWNSGLWPSVSFSLSPSVLSTLGRLPPPTSHSSVRLKMVSMRSEKPTCAPPRLSEVSLMLTFETVPMLMAMVVLRPFREIVERFFFPRLSTPGDRWRHILGIVPAGMTQAPQHFRSSETQTIWDGCFASVVSLHSDMSRAVHSREFPRVDEEHWHIPSLGFPFHVWFVVVGVGLVVVLASSLNMWGWWYMYVAWLSPLEGNPAEGMGDCFHLHCQAGGWDRIIIINNSYKALFFNQS